MKNNKFKPTTFLKAFLVLAGIFLLFAATIMIRLLNSLGSSAPILAKCILVFVLISILFRIISMVGMWRGKRWGVYVYSALTIIWAFIGVWSGDASSLLYLTGLVVLYFAVKPNWDKMT